MIINFKLPPDVTQAYLTFRERFQNETGGIVTHDVLVSGIVAAYVEKWAETSEAPSPKKDLFD